MAFSCPLELFPHGGIPDKPATDLLGLHFPGLAFLHPQQVSRTLLVFLSTATCEDSRGERDVRSRAACVRVGSWAQTLGFPGPGCGKAVRRAPDILRGSEDRQDY